MAFTSTSREKHSEVRSKKPSHPPPVPETSINSRPQESSLTVGMKYEEPISPNALPCGSKMNSNLTEESSHTEEHVSVVNQTECLSEASQSLQTTMSGSIIEEKKLDKVVGMPASLENPLTSAEGESLTVLPVPMPRLKKRLSASLPDDYQVESAATEISSGSVCTSDINEPSNKAKVTDSGAENKTEMQTSDQASSTDMSVSQSDIKSTTEMQGDYSKEPRGEKTPEIEPKQIPFEIKVKFVDQVKPTEPLLPMPRIRKRLSASFNDDAPTVLSSPPFVPPFVPAPRSKKHLSDNFPDEKPAEANQAAFFVDQPELKPPLPSGNESSLDFPEKMVKPLELDNNKSVKSISVIGTKVTACPELSSINHEGSRQLVEETVWEKVSESSKALSVSKTAVSNAPQNAGKMQRQEERSREKNQSVEATVKNVKQEKDEDKVQLATVSLDETAATLDLNR